MDARELNRLMLLQFWNMGEELGPDNLSKGRNFMPHTFGPHEPDCPCPRCQARSWQPRLHTLTIEVTPKDIEDGKRRDSWQCPLCIALFRITGQKFIVEDNSIYPLGQRGHRVDLPAEARTFIEQFDRTGRAQPISLKLQVWS